MDAHRPFEPPIMDDATHRNRAGATTESDVVVSGRTVRFTATPATPFGDETGTLTYVKPSSGAIRDPTGNEAAAFWAKTVDNIANSAATGAPGLTGAARVGATLTVSTGDITDANGLSGVSWRYRWILDDGSFDTDVGTNATSYTVAEADLGRRIRARVEFTDDDGHAEAVETTPVPVRAMQPAAVCPAPVLAGRTEVLSGTVTVAPRQDGSVTVGYGYYTDPSTLGALSVDDFSFGMVDYTVQAAAVTAPAPGELLFDLDRALSAAARRSLRLHLCGETYAFTEAALDGTTYGWPQAGLDWSGHGTRALAISSAPNSAATGAPAVSGVARVGETVSASTAGIFDTDGLADVSYTYQWIRVDGTTERNISGETGRTYTVAAADGGKQLKVRVEQITTHGMRARVRYDRDLDPESRIDEVPSAYKVSFGGAEPESEPRSAQAARIEGREVVLTLPSWPADGVWVSYEPHRPQLAKYRLRDAQGIDAPTFDFIEASPAPKPRVLAAQTTSGPGSNRRWDAGEMVRAEVRFSAPVTVEQPSGASGPTLELNLDGARRKAAYEGGSGTEVLLFALPVSDRDAGARNASVMTDGLAPGGSSTRAGDCRFRSTRAGCLRTRMTGTRSGGSAAR